jgi:hypothetical protein
MESALDEAVISGQNALSRLMREESQVPGEWEYLTGLRTAEELPAPQDEAVRTSLLRRQIVVPGTDGTWKLRAPLMGRWLRLRG